MVKQEAEANITRLEAAMKEADLEEKRIRTELSAVVAEHLRKDAEQTKGIQKDLEWIRRGVDRLMEAEMKKGNIP